MELFIFILCLALGTSFPLLGGYESLDTQQAQSDPKIQSLIDQGLEKTIEAGLQEGDFSSSNFELYKVNSAYKQQGSQENYKFNCQYLNDEGYLLDAYYEISYKPDDNDIRVTDYSYNVTQYSAIGEIEGLYTQVTSSEFEYSNEIQKLVIYGANQFIKNCIDAGTLPDDQYQVSEFNWIYRQVYENSFFYKCNLYIVNKEGKRAEANYTIYYQPLINNYSLIDYSCVYDDGQVYVVSGTVTPVDSHYHTIPKTQLNYDAVKKGLDYGYDQVTQIASNDGKIPNTNLEILDVIKAESQVVGNGVYYKFSCKLGDNGGVTMTTWFTVYCDYYASEYSLVSYSYETDIIGGTNQNEEAEIPREEEVEFTGTPVNEEDQIPGEEQGQEEGEDSQGDGRLSIFDQVFPLPETDSGEEGDIEVENVQEQEQEQIIEENLFDQGDAGELEEEAEVIIEEIPELQGGEWEDYEELGTNQTLYDDEDSQVLQYGFDTVLEIEKNDGAIPKYDYKVNKINKAGKKHEDQGDFYKFDFEASSEEGTKLSISFTGFYAYNTQEISMVSYTYQAKSITPTTVVKDTISTEGEYIKCDQEEIDTDETIQGALEYGVSQIYGYVGQQEDISTTGFSVEQIVNVYKQETVTGSCYKCEVVLGKQDNTYIKANFTVYYDSESGQYSVADYEYDLQESGDSGNEEEEETGEGGDSYENIDADAWEYDEYYNEMLEFAISVVIRKGYQSNQIPESGYKIKDIVSAEKKQQDNDNYYKCTIRLQDKNKVVITLKFTASITITTRSKKLWDWSYDVSNGKSTYVTPDIKISYATYTEIDTDYAQYDQEIQSCIIYGVDQIVPKPQDYTLSKINSIYRQVVDNSVYYKYDIELSSKEKDTQFKCTVAYRPDIGTKDVVAYYYKDKPASSSNSYEGSKWWNDALWSSAPSSSGSSWDTDFKSIDSYEYEQMNVDDLKGDGKYQGLLDYGVKECVEDLYDNKVIESKDYEVYEVVDAYKQEYDEYENCQMGVKLKNKYGVTLEVKFNVQYEWIYQDKTITSYWMKGYYDSDESQTVMVNYNGGDGGQYEIENCESVYYEEVEASPYLKEIVDYGVAKVIHEVAKKENISYRDFEVKKVKNVYREKADSNNYRVYASLENLEGKKIECGFSVNYQPKEDKKNLDWYSYISY